MRIGVLASQGAFIEHIAALRQLRAEALPVRLAPQLNGLDGLIIPGGESTAITKLMLSSNLTDEIKNLVRKGMPTCLRSRARRGEEEARMSFPPDRGLQAISAL